MGIDYFKLIAPFYDWGIRNYDPRQLIKFLDLQESGRLLDVGGGTGRVSGTLIEYADRIIISDRSIEMLFQAKNKPGIYSVCSLSELLPFPDDYFERVIIVDSLHHIQNQKDTVVEMWRVLRPGGRLIIEEVDITKIKGKLIVLMEKVLMMNSQFLLPDEILALFDGYEFNHHVAFDDMATWVVINKPE